jgi:hypothetical protein
MAPAGPRGTRGLSRDAVSRAECGELDSLTIRSLSRLIGALNATLVIEIHWQGADLDRLIDREHAHVQDAAARRLASLGWTVQAEVSFNHYGDRGSCDLIAWHDRTQTLLVVEVKSRLGNLQDTLHRLDVKVRLGGTLARQFGWPRPQTIVRALIIAEAGDCTAHRQTPRRAFWWLRTAWADGLRLASRAFGKRRRPALVRGTVTFRWRPHNRAPRTGPMRAPCGLTAARYRLDGTNRILCGSGLNLAGPGGAVAAQARWIRPT